MKRRGHTLAEMMVAVALLGIMMGAILYLYLTGGRAVSQGDVRSDLLRCLQVTSQTLTREVETGTYAGLSVQPAGLAILGAAPPEGGSPTLALDGSVVWRKYVVFWLNPGEKTVRRRDYPIPPSGLARPLEEWESLPFAHYAQQGSVVARDMIAFEPSVIGTGLLRTVLRSERIFRDEPRTVALEVLIRLRN